MDTAVLVDIFLENFKVKLGIWSLTFFSDRQKNTQTLADLEISFNDVRKILAKLTIWEYSSGPLPDKMLDGAEMWIFGQIVKGREIYIKITLGRPNNPVICISFHIAEHPMIYPLRV